MQVDASKISKARIIHYPILRLNKDDIKDIYILFKKYFINVGATIVYNDYAYQIDSENDLDLPGNELLFFEMSGFSPFASLILCREKARLYISDSCNSTSIALNRDIDMILSNRISRWNLVVSKPLLAALILCFAASLVLLVLNPGSRLYYYLSLLNILLITAWFFIRDYLYSNKYTQIIANPILSSGKWYMNPHSVISQDWRTRIKGFVNYSVQNISRYIIFLLIGSVVFWLSTL